MKAAGYVRVSTQEQVEHGLNLEEDKLRIREMCEQRGWELVEIYDDGGTQGDDPNRPGLLRLLAEAQRFDVVIIRAQDRITRDPGIWATVTAALALADVDLETFNGPIDFRSPAGEFSSNVMAAMGKLEKRLIGQRTKQALAARARKGLHTGGPAPFGYRWRDKQLVQMPAEARIVERIFSDYLNGKGQRILARELHWPQSKVCRIVGSEFYAGKVNGVDGQHEAIISAEVFERARQLRTKRGKTAGGRHADGGHLLTHGMLRCGRCGEAMIPRKRRPGIERDRYICGGRIKHGPGSCSTPSIPREEIDAPLLASLLDRYVDLEATLERIETARRRDIQAAGDHKAAAERELALTEARLARVQRGYQDGVLDDDDYRQQRAGLLEELKAAQEAARRAGSHAQALGRLDAGEDLAAALYRHLGEVKAAVADGVTRAPDLRALRHTIRQVFERVVIEPARPEYVAEGVVEEGGWMLSMKLAGGALPWCAPRQPLAMPDPTGQATPVPEWQSYPNGFLCRYCWW